MRSLADPQFCTFLEFCPGCPHRILRPAAFRLLQGESLAERIAAGSESVAQFGAAARWKSGAVVPRGVCRGVCEWLF